jgi:hypothetical protein
MKTLRAVKSTGDWRSPIGIRLLDALKPLKQELE